MMLMNVSRGGVMRGYVVVSVSDFPSKGQKIGVLLVQGLVGLYIAVLFP